MTVDNATEKAESPLGCVQQSALEIHFILLVGHRSWTLSPSPQVKAIKGAELLSGENYKVNMVVFDAPGLIFFFLKFILLSYNAS